MLDPSVNRRVTNRTHRSRTDPEATLAQKRGTALQLKYKVRQTIDAESRVILDAEVTTGGPHDNQPYLEQLRRIEDQCHCTIQEATADRGHSSAEILKALKAKGAKTYISRWYGRSGRNSGAAAGMNYESEQDRIRCPAGKYLYSSPANYENRRRFVSPPAACRGCPRILMSRQSKTAFSPYAIRASSAGPGPLRRRPSSNERAGLRQEGRRADVEVRGAVRRGEAIPRLVARQVSGALEGANSGLPTAPSCRTSSACSSRFIAGWSLIAFVQHADRVGDRQSPHLPIRPINCQQKSDFFNRPVRLMTRFYGQNDCGVSEGARR